MLLPRGPHPQAGSKSKHGTDGQGQTEGQAVSVQMQKGEAAEWVLSALELHQPLLPK